VVAESGAEAAAPAVPAARRGWTALIALWLVVALTAIVAWQAYQLNRVDDELSATSKALSDAVAAGRDRTGQVEQRANELELQAGRAFNPEAISTAVLPSVYRVRAGNFTGTAFAVGDKAAQNRTNLLTNYHVVESVFEAGDRDVVLERDGNELPARIVKTNKGKDVALLQLNRAITGLPAAGETVKPGQQIVVVGAPLGLDDSVTTGVVSAIRAEGDSSPPTTIQFDAPINPGNSGGPVVNSAKEVVGLATAKARDAEGIGLAIPIKTACDVFANVC
jgi:S1-C subfamily serine protease